MLCDWVLVFICDLSLVSSNQLLVDRSPVLLCNLEFIYMFLSIYGKWIKPWQFFVNLVWHYRGHGCRPYGVIVNIVVIVDTESNPCMQDERFQWRVEFVANIFHIFLKSVLSYSKKLTISMSVLQCCSIIFISFLAVWLCCKGWVFMGSPYMLLVWSSILAYWSVM